ncbi:MAG: hypothetical protein AB7P04_02420 [Bacteriovoracia bacterium]
MKVLIVADPITGLLPRSDTGLILLRESLARGHETHWAQATDVGLAGTQVIVRSKRVLSCAENKKPLLDKAGAVRPVAEFNSVWIRKDPPFDDSYVSLCWLLQLAAAPPPDGPEARDVRSSLPVMVNHPGLLLRYHEKTLPFLALRTGYLREADLVPTLLSGSIQSAKDLPPSVRTTFSDVEIVTKPWLGHGGGGVRQHPKLETALKHAAKADRGGDRQMIQPLVSEVTTAGDRRAFFLNGQYRGGFIRLPKKGGIISNLAAGGSAVDRPLTPREKELCDRLSRFFTEIGRPLGLYFAGVDLLAGRVSEINVTAPTGLAKLNELTGAALAPAYLDFVERLVARRP